MGTEHEFLVSALVRMDKVSLKTLLEGDEKKMRISVWAPGSSVPSDADSSNWSTVFEESKHV